MPKHLLKKATIKCAVVVLIEGQDEDLTPAQITQAQSDLEAAIQRRLFRDGFLADDVLVDRYEITAIK